MTSHQNLGAAEGQDAAVADVVDVMVVGVNVDVENLG